MILSTKYDEYGSKTEQIKICFRGNWKKYEQIPLVMIIKEYYHWNKVEFASVLFRINWFTSTPAPDWWGNKKKC